MLDQHAIENWRRTVSSSYQLDMSNAILDCSTASSTSTRTPERPRVHLVCPTAPKKRRRRPALDLDLMQASRTLFHMKDQSTQTDQSLGISKVKGLALHLLTIQYGCSTCRTLMVGQPDEVPDCQFCQQPMRRSVGTNVGLYHLVPYFE